MITNRGRPNEICLNDGEGNFDNTLSFGSVDDSTIDVETADMDADGDLDLILANRDFQQNYVYLNNGALDFSVRLPFGTGSDNTRSVAVSDINSDGILDIILANIDEPNRIYFGSDEVPYSEWIEFDASNSKSYAVQLLI